MKGGGLLVFHSHWRVGGVRSVVERSLPEILKRAGWSEATLVSGENAPSDWLCRLRSRCHPIPLHEITDAGLGYVSELQHPPAPEALNSFWGRVLRQYSPAAVWVHNPALARNIPAVESLLARLEGKLIPVLFHHHDLWCDHRWNRLPEMLAGGYSCMSRVACALFPDRENLTHILINSRDFQLFRAAMGKRAQLLPNPFDPPLRVSEIELRMAKDWLLKAIGEKHSVPVWLAPARLLRRKNLLESLLVLHRSSQEAILVIGNRIPSRDEARYAEELRRLSAVPAARLRLVDLNSADAPPMANLQAAADVLVQSSLQEGFGLLFLDAAWTRHPLVCRRLPNVWPDLQRMGLDFPNAYEEVIVKLTREELRTETALHEQIFQALRIRLPEEWRHFVAPPPVKHSSGGNHIPFSRLTLRTQLDVLLREINRSRANSRSIDSGPAIAKENFFSTRDYAREFLRIAHGTLSAGSEKDCPAGETSRDLQEAIARDALSEVNLFPLLLE